MLGTFDLCQVIAATVRRAPACRHLRSASLCYSKCNGAVLSGAAKLRGLDPDREVRELVKLAAAQGARLEELERRLRAHAATAGAPDADPERGAAGPAPDPETTCVRC